MATNTNINFPQSEFLDAMTRRPAREWMFWLMNPSVISINSSNALGVASGGTGLSTIPAIGQLLIGNGTGYALNTLTPGAGISVTNAAGSITLANTGVLSWSGGSTGLTPATATTGAVTLSGLLNVASGGTNSTAAPTAGAVPYGTGTAYAFTGAGIANQVLTSAAAGAPTWNTGINFTANTPAAGMTSQLLNWYEEGTWTPSTAFATFVGAASSSGTYTRVGRQVTINGTLTGATSVTIGASGILTTSLPFTASYDGIGVMAASTNTASGVVRVTGIYIVAVTTIAPVASITFTATYFV